MRSSRHDGTQTRQISLQSVRDSDPTQYTASLQSVRDSDPTQYTASLQSVRDSDPTQYLLRGGPYVGDDQPLGARAFLPLQELVQNLLHTRVGHVQRH